jgi:rhomboid family GlyGly-CTERM serine protease
LIAIFTRRPELLLIGLAVCIANAPLLTGHCRSALMFQPEAVHAGQWWRLFTHPLAHVTWYHLLLDGSAFFILYHSLLENRMGRRLVWVFGSAIGSLAAAWASPNAASGLCGLSGVAHGLMAISALELVAAHKPRSAEWRVGLATFVFVVAKAAYEALSGHMFFAFLDFGLLGNPISVSHAGGVIGGILMLLFVPIRVNLHPASSRDLS